jgi:glycogen(starch) synthase
MAKTRTRKPSTPLSHEANDLRPMLFETSWEVCCQTGGIYTVLRSKAQAVVDRWGDNYWLIGPRREPGASIEFEPGEPGPMIAEVLEELRSRGIVIHAGHWLVSGHPQVLLVDLEALADKISQMKYFFYKDIGIGTRDQDWDLDGCVAMGYAVADFLMILHRNAGNRPMLAHFHEWQGAAAIPILKHRGASFPTVFTTHATQVGRSLCAANVDLYDHLANIDGEAVAYEHGIAERFFIERAAARATDVFTTVSAITSMEAEQFLGRKADVLLPNGLNIERFAAPYEFQNLHRQNKQLIHEFVTGHFFPSYTFDLDQTLYLFTAGRYEFRNKGFDVFIEALYELNNRLKAHPNGITVVAFIIAPVPYRSFNVTTLNRQAMLNELRETTDAVAEDMSRRLFHTIAMGRMPTTDDLLDEHAEFRLRRIMHAWTQGLPPTIVTHDLVDDTNDPVLRHLRGRWLVNNRDDPVKVVFHPEFITSTSPVLGLEYDEFVRGCHMGVFPSYYEPWGYTPMECVVRGIPAITSDLSGFGSYVISHFPDHNESGIYVAPRRGVSFQQTVDQVANWLYALTRLTPRERIELRNRIEAHAEHFDWANLTTHYFTARQMAFEKYYPNIAAVLPAE